MYKFVMIVFSHESPKRFYCDFYDEPTDHDANCLYLWLEKEHLVYCKFIPQWSWSYTYEVDICI